MLTHAFDKQPNDLIPAIICVTIYIKPPFVKNRQKSAKTHYLEKGVFEFCRASTIKPRRIECSVFFSTGQNGQTLVYRLVSGQLDVWLWRKHNFLKEDNDCAPLALTRVKPVIDSIIQIC